MHLISALSLWSIIFTTASANCNHNNCLRAVIASAFPSRNGTADCASYFEVSVTPTTSWSTITFTPTSVPNYASACSGSVAYSSACSCVGAVHTTKSIYPPIQTSKPYFIVSPTSCPSPVPTGAIVGQSDASFSNANHGLQYQAYPNSQLVIQNSTSGPFFVDTSVPSMLKMSDSQGNTLIIYSDGTFSAFLGNCELEIVGSWLGANVGLPRAKRDDLFGLLVTRQGSGFCSEILGYCNSKLGIFVNGAAGSALCFFLGTEIFEALGGGIGFLGNVLGPEVGIPTTLGGIVLGAALGKFVSSTAIGSSLCGGVTSLLGASLCDLCQCSAGKISCNGGPCQDSLSNPNNCSSCGKVCPSGVCVNGVCTIPQYDDNGLDDAAF